MQYVLFINLIFLLNFFKLFYFLQGSACQTYRNFSRTYPIMLKEMFKNTVKKVKQNAYSIRQYQLSEPFIAFSLFYLSILGIKISRTAVNLKFNLQILHVRPKNILKIHYFKNVCCIVCSQLIFLNTKCVWTN